MIPMKALAFMLLLGSGPLLAVDVWPVALDEVKLSNSSCSAFLKRAPEGKLLEVRITVENKTFTVPADEFKDLGEVDLKQCRILATTHKRKGAAPDLADGYLVIYLEHSIAGTERAAKVFFLFNSEGFSHRDRLIPLAEPEKWEIRYKEPGEAEKENGTTKSSEDRIDPPSPPVRN
jgi:hypothetical protein